MKKKPESENQKIIRGRIVISLNKLSNQISEKKVIIGSDEYWLVLSMIMVSSGYYQDDIDCCSKKNLKSLAIVV